MIKSLIFYHTSLIKLKLSKTPCYIKMGQRHGKTPQSKESPKIPDDMSIYHTSRYALCKQVLINGLKVNDLINLIYGLYIQIVDQGLEDSLGSSLGGYIIGVNVYITGGLCYCSICNIYSISQSTIIVHSARVTYAKGIRYHSMHYHPNCYVEKYGPLHIFNNSKTRQDIRHKELLQEVTQQKI